MVTIRLAKTVGRASALTGCGRAVSVRLTLFGRGATGATSIRTVRCSDDGGAAIGRPGSLGVPYRADIPTTAAIAPVINAAARTRAHVSLMFLPPSVDTSIKGSIGTRGKDLRGSIG
jgi:hypothetical protein